MPTSLPIKGGHAVVHGGAGANNADRDGCVLAASRAVAALRSGADALDAAVTAVSVMEDDDRFNAGTGSVLCLDGGTVEMDAAVMDTRGRLGAVACLQRVRNPVRVAHALTRSPHWLLCGEGAERFARNQGFADYDPVTERARRKHVELMEQIAVRALTLPGEGSELLSRFWNYPATSPDAEKAPCDTVGAVVRQADGHFAVAGSTGGSAPSLLGRVGDTPIIGSGFYAGPRGAVAATGIGEQIVRHLLAHTVYNWIANGLPLQAALQRGVDLFPPSVVIGLIAVSATESGACSNRDMPWAEAPQDE